MYTIERQTRRVRDAAGSYGGGLTEREGFPAEGALRDLGRGGAERDVGRIVARYCVLRYVLLVGRGEVSGLVAHARAAAVEHLRAEAPFWAEGWELRRVVEDPGPPAVTRLVSAAVEAEAAGHLHGALASRRAAYAVARRHRLDAAAAPVARGIGAFLRRRGVPGAARQWERRAQSWGGRRGGDR